MRVLMLLTLAAALASAGCGSGSDEGAKKPGGQVIAEFDGEEVTMRELAAELRGANFSDIEVRKAAERSALQAIINRKILASAAKDQGLEKAAEFQLIRHRSEELLLAQETQKQTAAKIARPNREEAERYIAANPHNFAQRKIYTVDQIQFSIVKDRKKLKEFAGLKTLDQIEQKLLSSSIDYKKSPGTIDTVNVPPRVVNQIVKVPAGEVFIVPNGQTVVANRIRETKVVPFAGEAAIAQAQQMLFRDRATEALSRQIGELRKKVGKVNYKAGFGPPAENAPKINPGRTGTQSPSDERA